MVSRPERPQTGKIYVLPPRPASKSAVKASGNPPSSQGGGGLPSLGLPVYRPFSVAGDLTERPDPGAEIIPFSPVRVKPMGLTSFEERVRTVVVTSMFQLGSIYDVECYFSVLYGIHSVLAGETTTTNEESMWKFFRIIYGDKEHNYGRRSEYDRHFARVKTAIELLRPQMPQDTRIQNDWAMNHGGYGLKFFQLSDHELWKYLTRRQIYSYQIDVVLGKLQEDIEKLTVLGFPAVLVDELFDSLGLARGAFLAKEIGFGEVDKKRAADLLLQISTTYDPGLRRGRLENPSLFVSKPNEAMELKIVTTFCQILDYQEMIRSKMGPWKICIYMVSQGEGHRFKGAEQIGREAEEVINILNEKMTLLRNQGYWKDNGATFSGLRLRLLGLRAETSTLNTVDRVADFEGKIFALLDEFFGKVLSPYREEATRLTELITQER